MKTSKILLKIFDTDSMTEYNKLSIYEKARLYDLVKDRYNKKNDKRRCLA